MPSASTAYFSVQALRARYAVDLDDAVVQGRITAQQRQWLGQLSNPMSATHNVNGAPRADQIVFDDGNAVGAELAAAMLLSDPAANNSSVFLHTLLDGLEVFASREHLLRVLNERYRPVHLARPQWEYQRIEVDPFERRMRSIIAWHGQSLSEFSDHLLLLPSLQTAVGHGVQRAIKQALPATSVDVFSHLLQWVFNPAPSDPGAQPVVVGINTLAESAFDALVQEPSDIGMHRRFLDIEGRALTPAQAKPYSDAIDGVRNALKEPYEQLLERFWSDPLTEGQTRQQVATRLLTETFRHCLLVDRQALRVSPQEFGYLSAMLAGHGASAGALDLSRLSISIANQQPVKLAGLCVIDLSAASLSGLLLFSARYGLRRFTAIEQVADYFLSKTGRAEILACTSLNDHEWLDAEGPIRLRLDPLGQPLFSHLMDSIIALQKRNLAYVLTLPGAQANKAAVFVDDALDIRELTNPGLLALGSFGRWRDVSTDFEHLWPQQALSSRRPPEPVPAAGEDVPPTWMEYLKWVQRKIDRQGNLHPGVAVCARGVLNAYLTVFSGGQCDVRYLWVKASNGDLRNVLLLFLDRVTGHVAGPLSDDCQVLTGVSETAPLLAVAGLTAVMLEQMLDLAKNGFRLKLAAHLRRSHAGPLRRLDTQLLPKPMSIAIRSSLLRLGWRMEARLGEMGARTLGMFEQVLDRPTFSLRSHFGDDITEVYAVHVDYQPYHRVAPMTDMFVLQQPWDSSGKLVLWSPFRGLYECASPTELGALVNLKLADPATRTQWLDCFNATDRERIAFRLSQSLPVKVNLERIDGHFIEHLQNLELERQVNGVMEAYDSAVQWRLDAGLTGKLTHAADTSDNVRSLHDSLSHTLEVSLFKAFAPQWLNEASVADLFTFSALLRRAYVAQSVEQDFMFNVPALKDYAHEQLTARLHKDLGDQAPDPDLIIVTLTRYVGAPTAVGEIPSSVPGATLVVKETLTRFAINRFSGVQDGILSFALADESLAIRLPDPDYLSGVVLDLDVGARYRALLDEKLNEHDPSHARRLRSFVEQMPPLQLLSAFELKLCKQLSDKAWRYIRSVLEMPDGIARLPEEGENIVLSPLQLVPEPGGNADLVTGMYVITAQDSTQGPWILYTLLGDDMDFKEYPNEVALLADVQSTTSLQALILERLTPQARKTYDNGGFREPHLPWSAESSFDLAPYPPAPPRLLLEPVSSNVLRYLFDGMKAMLRLAAVQSSVTTAEFNSQAYRFLMTLGTEQALMLLPGRLGLLVGAWQSQSWLEASANALHERKWGKALSEISAALGVLISARQDPKDRAEEAIEESIINEQSWIEEGFSWGNGQLTPALRNRLARLEASNISLSELEKDSLFNVYRDRRSKTEYAAIGGKVYPVAFTRTGWRIANGEALGPGIRLNEEQQWELDISGGLKGGGGMVSRLGNPSVSAHLEHIYITEASGIPEIRRLYPDRARRFGEAHLHARHYLHTARSNLQVEPSTGQIPAKAQKILADFFGVKVPGERLLSSIRRILDELNTELLDHSLSPFSSSRIVVGTNRFGHQGTSAFTFTSDVNKRIFLTEQFFRAPLYRLKPPPSGQNGFNVGAHFRTAIFLHELSHIANNSLDIAYVESSAPYLDLLYDSGEYYGRVKRGYEKCQQRCLSHLTPPDDLFKDTTSDDAPRDLKASDGDAKPTILRITGRKTLNEARDVFYADADKRADIILSNADSITLLVTLLGRERFTPPTP